MTAPGEPLLAAPSSRLCSPLPPERLGSGRTLLPLGPTTAPPGVGRARVAARLATTSCSFRCPHRPWPAWCGAQSLETLSLCHRGKARLASPAASLGVSPSSLQRAGQSVAEVAAMTVVPGAGELAAECSLDAGADTAPPRALSRRAVFLVGPLGLSGAGLHAGCCRARASALGGRRSVRTEALWVGVSRLGPGGRGVRAPIPCPDGPAGCRGPSARA